MKSLYTQGVEYLRRIDESIKTIITALPTKGVEHLWQTTDLISSLTGKGNNIQYTK